MKKEDPIIRFHRKYTIDPETDCWIWKGSFYNSGYARFKVNKKERLAHRFSYDTFVGHLDPNLEICHNCNNKKCVNFNHLRQDTSSSNQIDKSYAFTHSKQKLTVEQVIEIKRALLNPYRGINKNLADKYGVTAPCISEIKLGKSWSHLSI